MVERSVEPTIVRNFADVAADGPVNALPSDPTAWRPPSETQYASPLCVWVLMEGRITGSNFIAKMHDSLLELPACGGRLFTSQRGRRGLWYAALAWTICAGGTWAPSSLMAQTMAEVAQYGVVCEVELTWDSADIVRVLEGTTGATDVAWQVPLESPWWGVQDLDTKSMWVPL